MLSLFRAFKVHSLMLVRAMRLAVLPPPKGEELRKWPERKGKNHLQTRPCSAKVRTPPTSLAWVMGLSREYPFCGCLMAMQCLLKRRQTASMQAEVTLSDKKHIKEIPADNKLHVQVPVICCHS